MTPLFDWPREALRLQFCRNYGHAVLTCGFDPAGMNNFAEKTPGIIRNLSRLAIENRIMIAGSMPQCHKGHVYNTLFLIDENGSIAGKYRKIHLFPLLGEDASFKSGKRTAVCRTSIGAIGLMICYDLRFPELCRSLALQGAQIVVVSAQWPATRIDHWDVLLRARAIENQIYIIACNRIGREGDLSFSGHSQIISPTGKVISILEDCPGEVSAEIDLSVITTLKRQFDSVGGRIPDAYEY
jgi:omega-amidase